MEQREKICTEQLASAASYRQDLSPSISIWNLFVIFFAILGRDYDIACS